METSQVTENVWWTKGSKSDSNLVQDINKNISRDVLTTSLAEFFEKETDLGYLEEVNNDEDVDIGSILEEITRLSAKSPLGPYDRDIGDRSIDDIMKEVEKLYLESSKSFEQLSQRSKTSHNISELASSEKSDNSTPTPKSISPLPLDDVKTTKFNLEVEGSDNYSDDSSEKSEKLSSVVKEFDSNENEVESFGLQIEFEAEKPATILPNNAEHFEHDVSVLATEIKSGSDTPLVNELITANIHEKTGTEQTDVDNEVIDTFKKEIFKKDEVIQMLIIDNRGLKEEIKSLETQMDELRELLVQTSSSLKAQNLKSPVVNLELDKALEELKDTKEINTALQLQLDSTNKSHQTLKTSYEELVSSNKSLERRMMDVDSMLAKYRSELQSAQLQKEKLLASEANVSRLLELERTQVKNLKQHLDKDSKCILDLNRQIKEMERIIARKHPDSVSALIVAAKNEAVENTPTTRKVLEDRIKVLEKEALLRDAQNSQVFVDVQEKFNQMKLKYESHIDDLELHVSDLKTQLKRRVDTYDVYTQTIREDQKIPEKDTSNASIQTDPLRIQQPKTVVSKKPEREREVKEETHLLATIRGFQADLSNKEKVIIKLQKEIDELRKTNRRLQKEREGSLKNLSDKKEFRSYPEKLASQASNVVVERTEEGSLDEELRNVKTERDKMKFQLCRIEEDYQALKSKRLQDLNTLQEAHEREISTYLANITPLREQLEVQQVSVSTLQQQLVTTKEQLVVVTVERDHLNNRVNSAITLPDNFNGNDDSEVVGLRKRIAHLEMKYEERENRLRAIVHGLAQKTVTNRSCEQCAARQQQLVGYKAELDQIIATLRCMQ